MGTRRFFIEAKEHPARRVEMMVNDQTGWRQRIERALAELRDAPAIEAAHGAMRSSTTARPPEGARSTSATP